jgi:hypothetical protein
MWGCQHPAVSPAPKQQLLSLNPNYIMWAKFCSLQIFNSIHKCLWISKNNYATLPKKVEVGDYHCLCKPSITVLLDNWTTNLMRQILSRAAHIYCWAINCVMEPEGSAPCLCSAIRFHRMIYLKSIILSIHKFPTWSIPTKFFPQKLCMHFLFPCKHCTCSTYHILLWKIILRRLGEDYNCF